MSDKARQFIVMYDDGQGLCVPFTWDDDCDGALCSRGAGETVAVFPSRADARKAIRISNAYAKLCVEQGKPSNTDFTTTPRFIIIAELKGKPS